MEEPTTSESQDLKIYPSLRSAFERLVADFERANIPYAVLGALARAAWGTVRATTDIDFTMRLAPSDLDRLTELFRGAGFERLAHPRVPSTGDTVPDLICFKGRSADRTEALRVDILVSKVEYMDLALKRREKAISDTVSCWAVSPEDLIVYKLIAHRGMDLSDIENVVATQTARGRKLDWAYIRKWAKEWDVEKHLKPFLPRQARTRQRGKSRKRRPAHTTRR